MKKNKNGAVKCVKTVRYLEALLAYKRTHTSGLTSVAKKRGFPNWKVS